MSLQPSASTNHVNEYFRHGTLLPSADTMFRSHCQRIQPRTSQTRWIQETLQQESNELSNCCEAGQPIPNNRAAQVSCRHRVVSLFTTGVTRRKRMILVSISAILGRCSLQSMQLTTLKGQFTANKQEIFFNLLFLKDIPEDVLHEGG